jgi:hypothetical protein
MPEPQIEDLGPAAPPSQSSIEELGPAAVASGAEDLGPVDKSLRNAPPHIRKVVAGSMSRFQQQAAENEARIKAEQEAPGSFLGRVADRMIGGTVGPVIASGMELLKGPESHPMGSPLAQMAQGALGAGKIGMEALNVPFQAASQAAGTAIQEGEVARGTPFATAQGMGDVGAAATDVGTLAAFGAQGIKGMMKGAREPVVDPNTGQTILKNPPADPAAQADYLQTLEAKGVDTMDSQAIKDHVATREGVDPKQVDLTVDPNMPISKTELDQMRPSEPAQLDRTIAEDGPPVVEGSAPPPKVKVQIEPGTPGEVATRIEHEVGNHVPEKLGMAEAPIEDNNAIVAEGIAKEQAGPPPPQGPSIPDKLGDIPPELSEPMLKEGISRKVVTAAGKLFTDGLIERDPSKLISDQVMELVTSGKVDMAPIQAILDRNGVGLVEFGQEMLRVKVADAGRTMQAYSEIQRAWNLEHGVAGERDISDILFNAYPKDESIWAKLYWGQKQVRNIWRGLLTSQVSTSVRNVLSQGGRAGIEVMNKSLSAGIQTLMGKKAQAGFEAVNKLDTLDGFHELLNLFRDKRNKGLMDELTKQMPKVGDQLFTRYNSDVVLENGAMGNTKADRVVAAANKAVRTVNWLNTTQEFFFRRASMVTALETKLGKVGKTLEGVLADKEAAKYFSDGVGKKIMEDSITDTLDKTFANSPDHGTVVSNLIKAVNDTPVLNMVIPFPRFMYNASKFFFEHSPLGLLKILSPAERAQIAAGNVSTYSKAITGTIMFGAYYQFRQSKWAGEKWYEAKIGNHTIDMRAFNPYTGALLAADIIHRWNSDEIDKIDWKEMADTALSSNVKGGSGLYVLDQLALVASNRSNSDKLTDFSKRVAGEFVGGFLTPAQTLTDAMADWPEFAQKMGITEDMKQVRNVQDEPFLGPIKQRLPMNTGLPPLYSALQSEPVRRVSPALKQATGLRVQEQKNPVQEELDRLALPEREMVPKSGDNPFDQLVARKMGPMVEDQLIGEIASSDYQKKDPIERVAYLKQRFKRIHADAIKEAKAEEPAAYEAVKEGRKPWFEKELVEEHPQDVQEPDEAPIASEAQ